MVISKGQKDKGGGKRKRTGKWKGRRKEGMKRKGSRAGSTLTTGLALAELALEEARELELRWPLYSEGCHRATTGCTDRNKGTGSAKRQRDPKPPRSHFSQCGG